MGSPEPTDRESIIREIRRNYSERRCTDIQQLLSTLSNPIRFRILCALRTQPFTVGDLVAITDSHLSNISQHLKMMWMAGYISKRRDGKQVYYALEDPRIHTAIDQLERMYPPGSYESSGTS
jgi:DNA-binding transcriptional ArsR family regulator